MFLPQFVNPQRGSVASQLMVLAFVFHAMLGLGAGFLGRNAQAFLRRNPHVQMLQRWSQAAAMTALAAYLFFTDRPVTGKP